MLLRVSLLDRLLLVSEALVNEGLDSQYFDGVDYICSPAGWVGCKCIELLYDLTLHVVVVGNDLLASLHNLCEHSTVGLAWAFTLLLQGLVQHQERNGEVLRRGVSKGIERTEEAK